MKLTMVFMTIIICGILALSTAVAAVPITNATESLQSRTTLNTIMPFRLLPQAWPNDPPYRQVGIQNLPLNQAFNCAGDIIEWEDVWNAVEWGRLLQIHNIQGGENQHPHAIINAAAPNWIPVCRNSPP